MIEEVVIKYLEDKLGIKAYAEKPNRKTSEYIVVEKIDGGRINQINASTLSVFSYADTLFKAAALNERVKETLLGIIELEEISSSKIGGEGRNIDSNNREYRYETIINLYHY